MAAFHNHRRNNLSCGDAHLQELTHWFVSMRCATHIAHGALTRSLGALATDRVVLKAAWITLAALRSSVGQLSRVGPSWINQRVAFQDWDMPLECQEQLWRVFGFPREVVDELLRLQLR